MENYEEYKKVRNNLREYDPSELLNIFIKKSYEVKKLDYGKRKGYLPWTLSVLIEWTLLDWDNFYCRREIDSKSLNKIAKKMENFQNNSISLLEIESEHKLIKFMRRMAYQQFPYQSEASAYKFGMNIKLFRDLKHEFPVEVKLKENFNLNLESYFYISFICYCLYDGNIPIKKENFNKFLNLVSEEEIDGFFKLTSRSPEELRNIVQDRKIKDYEHYLYLPKIFTYYPFINFNKNFKTPDFSYIQNLLIFFLYDYFRFKYTNEFSNSFGKVMEDYIRISLRPFDNSIITERRQKKEGLRKQVDFIIKGQKSIFLIESKATEPHPDSMATQEDQKLLRTSLEKGLKQIEYVSNKIAEGQLTDIENTSSEIFYFIITYKDLYFGHGGELWNEIIDKKFPEYDINPENLFFLSLREFDFFLMHCNYDFDEMVLLVNSIKSRQENPENKRLTFYQYFEDSFDKNKFNDHVNCKIYKSITSEIIDKFDK